MSDQFFSDRTAGPKPRDREHVPEAAWRALVALIDTRIQSHWLAREFPERCPDGRGVAGTDRQNLFDTMYALVDIEWPPHRGEDPKTGRALDLVDFVVQRVAKPVLGSWHSYFNHHELDFDQPAGQSEFRDAVNLIFARTGVAFELNNEMRKVRLGPPETRQVVADLRPATGDATLDGLLTEARRRYLSRDIGDGRLGLEKLWDAFERLKTIEPGADKKTKVEALLDRLANGVMRDCLNDEFKALTKIGNAMQIRHFEHDKDPVSDVDVDYLFGRMATLIVHALRSTSRLA